MLHMWLYLSNNNDNTNSTEIYVRVILAISNAFKPDDWKMMQVTVTLLFKTSRYHLGFYYYKLCRY